MVFVCYIVAPLASTNSHVYLLFIALSILCSIRFVFHCFLVVAHKVIAILHRFIVFLSVIQSQSLYIRVMEFYLWLHGLSICYRFRIKTTAGSDKLRHSIVFVPLSQGWVFKRRQRGPKWCIGICWASNCLWYAILISDNHSTLPSEINASFQCTLLKLLSVVRRRVTVWFEDARFNHTNDSGKTMSPCWFEYLEFLLGVLETGVK